LNGGRLQLNPYLFFNGNCEAAFTFYAQCLGGKITAMQSNADAPNAAQMTVEWRTKIRHACLLVGTREFMGADRRPEQYEAPKGFSVLLGFHNPAEAERIFRRWLWVAQSRLHFKPFGHDGLAC
jgi:PhnB protein